MTAPLILVDVGSMGGIEPEWAALRESGRLAAKPGYGVKVPGRNRVLRWGRKVAALLSRSDQGFSDGDPSLGNL